MGEPTSRDGEIPDIFPEYEGYDDRLRRVVREELEKFFAEKDRLKTTTGYSALHDPSAVIAFYDDEGNVVP